MPPALAPGRAAPGPGQCPGAGEARKLNSIIIKIRVTLGPCAWADPVKIICSVRVGCGPIRPGGRGGRIG